MYQYRLRLDSARLAARRSAVSILCEKRQTNICYPGLFDWVVDRWAATNIAVPLAANGCHLLSFAFAAPTCQQIDRNLAKSLKQWKTYLSVNDLARKKSSAK